MRFGTVAILVSAIAHTAILAGLATVDSPPPLLLVPPRTSVNLAPVPPRASTPIDIAVIRLPAPAAIAAVATTPPAAPRMPRLPASWRARGASTPAAIATATTAIDGTAATTSTGEPPATDDGPSVLDMRRPRIDVRATDAHEWARKHELSGGAPPPSRPQPSGELAPAGGGTFRSHQPGFVARVDRNGEVTFEDEDAFSFNFPLLDIVPALPGTVARSVETWYRDPYAGVRAEDRDSTSIEEAPGPDAIAGRRGDKPTHGGTVPIVGGRTEITDWVMRQGGIDPYASAKRQFLERTRDERMEMRRVETNRQLKDALHLARRHAQQVWARTDLDVAAKRTALFALWDDAAETGSDELVAAGDAARLAIIGFIRAHLPAGSPDAYSAAELAALNLHRQSKLRFAPYD